VGLFSGIWLIVSNPFFGAQGFVRPAVWSRNPGCQPTEIAASQLGKIGTLSCLRIGFFIILLSIFCSSCSSGFLQFKSAWVADRAGHQKQAESNCLGFQTDRVDSDYLRLVWLAGVGRVRAITSCWFGGSQLRYGLYRFLVSW